MTEPTVLALIALIVPTLTAILTYLKTRETHTAVNSRMDMFIKKYEDDLALLRAELVRSRAKEGV